MRNKLNTGKGTKDEMKIRWCLNGIGLEFQEADIRKSLCHRARADIGVISGLIDYFYFKTVESVLGKVREQLLPGGTVLIADMRRHYLASTMSILGDWHLVYREPAEVESILGKSGYEDIEVWLELERVFCIGKARNPG